jgi:hypothetical protein
MTNSGSLIAADWLGRSLLNLVFECLGDEGVGLLSPVGDQLVQGLGFEHQAGENVLPQLLRLLDDGNTLGAPRLVEQLLGSDGSGQAGGPGADDENVDSVDLGHQRSPPASSA